MSAGADDEVYRQALLDIGAAQGVLAGVRPEDLAPERTRAELGVSSLNVILLVATYLQEHAPAGTTFQPAWVARLDDVGGILSVLREIDAAGQPAGSVGGAAP